MARGAKALTSSKKKISSAFKCHLQLFITPRPKMFKSLKTEGECNEDLVETSMYSQDVSQYLAYIC